MEKSHLSAIGDGQEAAASAPADLLRKKGGLPEGFEQTFAVVGQAHQEHSSREGAVLSCSRPVAARAAVTGRCANSTIDLFCRFTAR